jgi:hypothetical protein
MDIIKKDQKMALLLTKEINELPRPYERDIYLFSTYIAGISHIENIEEKVNNFSETEVFSFYREPNNPYDKMAILVMNEKQEKIGYLPKVDNPVFARLMDAGKTLFGILKSIEKVGRWMKIKLDIYLKD